jgi:pyruvate ferredoxin oxidoreductase gamma subunit
MYRIRFHGRGGQGMKTASRILGTAFFHAGFEVQDAPRYGAERRGAPIFAYVRAARAPIAERGIIARPDLVVVADETLVPVPAAGVLAGVGPDTVLLVNSDTPGAAWRERLALAGPVVTLPAGAGERAALRYVGATCAGAAARLVGAIPRAALERALREELGALAPAIIAENLARAGAAYDAMAAHAGLVREAPPADARAAAAPDWIELAFEPARVSAPDIHAAATSVEVKTGLWRTLRPVIDYARCKRCTWVCGTLCPDSAIARRADGAPEIDYDHCKGCLVCVAVCPPHAIDTVPERAAQAAEARA